MEAFSITHYAPDGEVLGASTLRVADLSPKWLQVCRELLEGGPVFIRALTSPLQRFSIECAGSVCKFKVSGTTLFFAVLLTSASSQNYRELLAHFGDHIQPGPVEAPTRFPAFLILNSFAPGITEEDGHALFQLAYHFAGAFFEWAEA